jgi:hypothetical protein
MSIANRNYAFPTQGLAGFAWTPADTLGLSLILLGIAG